MTDKEFKAGLLIGAAGALVIAFAFSGSESTADRDHRSGNDYDYERGRGGDTEGRTTAADYQFGDDDEKKRRRRDDDTVIVEGLDSFNTILVKGGLDLNVDVGGRQSIEVSADGGRVNDVEFKVRDGQLIIDMPERGRSFWDDADVEVTITLPELTGFRLDGAADAEFTGIDADEFTLEVRGAGELEFSGKCGELVVELRGAGGIDMKDLKCKNALVELKGAGQILVYASESVDARLAGIGNIEVFGSPKNVRKRAGGLGSIDID